MTEFSVHLAEQERPIAVKDKHKLASSQDTITQTKVPMMPLTTIEYFLRI